MSKRHSGSIINQQVLARQLGVSQMTISRVLNDRPGVSQALKNKISAAIAKSDYIPDHIAVGLRINSTHVIGLIIPDVSNSFFPEITEKIENGAKEKGYRVILSHSYESYIQECKEINLLRGYRVDGFIIAPAGNQNEIEIYEKLQKLEIPFVFIDRIKKKIDCSYVISDTGAGALKIGRYLLKKGYRKWGYLRGPRGVSSSEEHLKGLQKSLKEAGRSSDIITSVRAGFSSKDGYRATKELLNKIKPDVIIAVNDPVAIGAYRFLKKEKVKVPEEVGLVGFSDLSFVDILDVPLTTVRESTADIGRIAIEILLKEISDSEREKQQILLAPKLIARASA